MEHKPITKKERNIQILSFVFYLIYGLYCLVFGIIENRLIWSIFGGLFTLLDIGYICYLFWNYKHNPAVDPKKDAELVANAKDSARGLGIVMGIIAAGFLIAFALASILT